MLTRNNASSSCQWIKEWMGFPVKTTCWETSSVLIKELDHYLDQGSSDVWYAIEISKFASFLNNLHYQLHVANIKLTWVMFDEILLSTPLMAAKYDYKNKLIIKTFNFLLASKKWKEGKISNNLAQACWNWMG